MHEYVDARKARSFGSNVNSGKTKKNKECNYRVSGKTTNKRKSTFYNYIMNFDNVIEQAKFEL